MLPPLFANLEPVMKNLSDPRTGLRRFFPALERAASIVAPVAETQAELFENLDITFAALAGVARPSIQETISRGPAAMEAGLRGFPTQRAFLENSTALRRASCARASPRCRRRCPTSPTRSSSAPRRCSARRR